MPSMPLKYMLLLATLLAALGGKLSANVLNQCPQPTDTNPDPSSFMYAHPDDCRLYFTCSDGKPKVRQCKPYGRATYTEFYHTCVGLNTIYDTCTRYNAQRECRRGFPGLIGHPKMCHRYYNCSQAVKRSNDILGDYEAECPYPQLFDIETRRCTSSKEATCGPHRQQPKDSCDYVKILCSGSHCMPCSNRLQQDPSCVGMEDGWHPFPGREWTRFYISCHKGKLVRKMACDKHAATGTEAYYSPVKKKCVSRWEVPRSTGYGLAPSCDGKVFGVYKTDERHDVYYSCPTKDVFYCESGTKFNEVKYMCELQSSN